MIKWVLWGVAALLLGLLGGVWIGLLLRRPSPEVTSYIAPEPSQNTSAVGPHRAVLKA